MTKHRKENTETIILITGDLKDSWHTTEIEMCRFTNKCKAFNKGEITASSVYPKCPGKSELKNLVECFSYYGVQSGPLF